VTRFPLAWEQPLSSTVLKEAELDQQKKSAFVNALAWIFIALAGFATLISILQNVMIFLVFPVDEMNETFKDTQVQEQIPFFARFMFSNIRLFFLGFLAISATALVSAIGLLKRKNWGRIIFLAIMGLGICWNLFGLVIQNMMFTSMPGFPHGEIDSQFSTMMLAMKIVTFIFAVGISYLFGWIIYKLCSVKIKTEFINNPAVALESSMGETEQPKQKTGKLSLLGSIALTIAVGVFYFGTGNIKSGPKISDVQQLSISGNATKLAELLSEQPHLANTIRQKDSWTPLHGAACNGHTECVRLLILAGADVNVQSCNQNTALHCSAEDGNAEIVSLLLSANANPNLKDRKGKTPLDWALWNNHQKIINLLKKHDGKTGKQLDEIESRLKSESDKN
jgi:hypothetical protein